MFFLVFGQGRFFTFSILVGLVSMTSFKTICLTKNSFMIIKTTFFWDSNGITNWSNTFLISQNFDFNNNHFQYLVSCFENKRPHLVTNIQKGLLWHIWTCWVHLLVSYFINKNRFKQVIDCGFTQCEWTFPQLLTKYKTTLYSCNVVNIHNSWRLCCKSMFNSLNGKLELDEFLCLLQTFD